MPRPHSWLPRLHEIRKAVCASVLSHFDRYDLQRIFNLQPRAASYLLQQMLPTLKVGQAHVVEKDALLKFLDRVGEAEDVSATCDLLKAEKEQVSRKRPRMLVRREFVTKARLDSLPETVSLSRGSVTISFKSRMEFLESVAQFIGAVDHDLDEFLERFVPQPGTEEQKKEVREQLRDVESLYRDLRQMEADRDKKLN